MENDNNIIAFQGVEGAHSDMACRTAYPYMETLACPTFDAAMKAVANGKATLCMIPIENSKAGRVAEVHNLLKDTQLFIVGETYQRIENHLIAGDGASLETIKQVYSHPQPLMQCKDSIAELGFEGMSEANTAVAAQKVAQWNDPAKAAIASKLAAEIYGLNIIKENMEDDDNNSTTFIVMAAEPIDPDPKDGKVVTSALFTARNIPAALYKSLGGFATNQVNLLKVESYIPAGSSEMAQFFISFEGHPQERNVQLAMEELGFFSRKVQVLGVYLADEKKFL
jgi:prephenate dehydratase